MEEQPRVRVEEPVLCFTSDVDWASEPCLEDLFGQLASRGIRPTVFATHRSEVLVRREAAGDVEVGIHPNFLPGSSHGAGEDEVIDHLLGLFPSARAFRSHCFVDSTRIVRRMLARGIRYDSNLCLFLEPELRPLRHGSGIVRLPVFWEDDCHWELTGGDWNLASYLGRFLTPGLKTSTSTLSVRGQRPRRRTLPSGQAPHPDAHRARLAGCGAPGSGQPDVRAGPARLAAGAGSPLPHASRAVRDVRPRAGSEGLSLDRLGAAVIGLGVGRRHIQAYRRLEGVEVRAICAQSAESVDTARKEYGVPDGSTDYREIVDRQDVQLVSICSPDGQHAEQALFALQCGKHVLVEKPVAVTLDEARALVDAVRSSGLTFASGQSYRFVPQFQALRVAAAAGQLGRLYLLQGRYEQDLSAMAERGPGYWRVRDPQDFLLGAGIHLVDFLRWAGGEVVEVAAYASHALEFYPGSENWVLGLRFASGAAGQAVVAVGFAPEGEVRRRFRAARERRVRARGHPRDRLDAGPRCRDRRRSGPDRGHAGGCGGPRRRGLRGRGPHLRAARRGLTSTTVPGPSPSVSQESSPAVAVGPCRYPASVEQRKERPWHACSTNWRWATSARSSRAGGWDGHRGMVTRFEQAFAQMVGARGTGSPVTRP